MKLLLQPGHSRSPSPSSHCWPGGNSLPAKSPWARQELEPCSSAWGDRVAPCPSAELSHGLSISRQEERLLHLLREKERNPGRQAGREGGRAAPGRCHGWFSSSTWAVTAAPWGREQAEQGRFMAVGQAQAEPNLLPSISFMEKMKCRTSSAGAL